MVFHSVDAYLENNLMSSFLCQQGVQRSEQHLHQCQGQRLPQQRRQRPGERPWQHWQRSDNLLHLLPQRRYQLTSKYQYGKAGVYKTLYGRTYIYTVHTYGTYRM